MYQRIYEDIDPKAGIGKVPPGRWSRFCQEGTKSLKNLWLRAEIGNFS
jgi:hypothetical protein